MRVVVKFVLIPLSILILIAMALMFRTPPPVSPTLLVATSASAQWLENLAYGLRLEINIPTGWQGRKTENGIVVAEQASALSSDHQPEGVRAHVFVRLLTDFQLPLPGGGNQAWAALKQVVEDKHYIREALVSEPYGFDWGGHDGAYYLLNDEQQKVMLIMAIIPATGRLVTFSISSPWSEGLTIRRVLPGLLRACKINGDMLDTDALDHLPDPLVFPEAEPTASS